MNMHYEEHAKEVVDRFKRMLTEEQVGLVGSEHFSELETLITAALGVVDSQAIRHAAKEVEALAHTLRSESREVG